jgi:hypothetical protein
VIRIIKIREDETVKIKTLLFFFILIALVVGVTSAADDGPLFQRNISRTPLRETGGGQLSIMSLYVPAQDTQGEPPDTASGELEYYAGDCTNQDTSTCTLVYTRPEARPLFSSYIDGMVDIIPEGYEGDSQIQTGAGFGERDAFAALSLDDGATWKNYNLSDSALRSSFTLANGEPYPGDVFKIQHAVEGNRIVVAYISRFCESGAPLYSWLDEEKVGLLAAYPELDHPVTVDGGTDPDGYYQLYMDDLFSVAGSQDSVDYTLQGFPEVGEIPYGCVWAARGTLEQALDESGNPLTNSNGDPVYDITWRASERLTSGRRDPHQINVTSSPGAGFIISWQEDPEGLRPGKGLGPGEGWSGAIANSKTDIWYTYLAWDHFGDVCLDAPEDAYCTPGTLAESVTSELFGVKPKVAVPFAVPVRLTDNNACKGVQRFDTNGELMDAYCYADFDENGTADLCATSESWTNPGGTTLEVCITEDGRHLTGRTASTRVRWAMKPYTKADGTVSAWVVLGEEKMKALGTELDPEGNVIDIGKNMWYHTFEFNNPELVAQGLMLNSPAKSPETGEFFEVNVDEWENEYYDTEISRRFNLMVQSVGDAMASPARTSAILIYKEGILFQGGPADIFIRRVVLPDDFDPAVDNPFAYENVVCDAFDGAITPDVGEWLYTDGSNPNYVRGLCTVQGMNVSGTTIVTCDDGSGGAACAEQFPFNATYEEWENSEDPITLPKVTEWRQCDGEAPLDGCVAGDSNFDDPSWANPYDVSKGHRGFIDGDFVMMMYATAPNWNANTVGNEAYNLYIRRSFDGGQTWTTLPAEYTHFKPLNPDVTITADGTTTCEDYGWGSQLEVETCTTYAAGAFEQARNVSRLTGSKITVLDPRYSPTGGMLKKDYTNLLCYDETAADGAGDWVSCGYTEAPYPEDVRDPSGFFVTYETGDNTVVTVETGAVPMDMYYSRAFNFGDDYDEQDVCATDIEDPWYPTAGLCEEGETDLRWDWLENGDELATEASVYGDPSGDRFYAVWNQELEVAYEEYTDMDVQFRRIFYNLGSDTYPSASILYRSAPAVAHDVNPTVLLVGTARDTDRMGPGIVGYRWRSSIDGELGNGQIIQLPAASLSVGFHDISFSAQDDEGNWSLEVSTRLLVAEQLSWAYIPTISR